MSEAPDRAYISWLYNDSGYACDVAKGYSEDIGPEYIRADIHEARVKELEAVVKEFMNPRWKRQDSLDTFDSDAPVESDDPWR